MSAAATCGKASRTRRFSCWQRRKLSVAPVHCLVVEDAPVGIRAARAGGMTALGVARQDDGALLRADGAELVVSSVDEIAVGELAHGCLRRRAV